MTDERRDEKLLDVAIREAVADTRAPLSPDRAREVFRRIQQETTEPRDDFTSRNRWAWGLVPLAIGLVFGFFVFSGNVPPALVDRPVLRFAQGDLAYSESAGGLGEVIRVPATHRIDVELRGARAIVFGPARVSLTADGASLREGRGVFSVARRTVEEGAFVVEVPKGRVFVLGTVFEVSVDLKGLEDVYVENGRVEVRLDGKPPRILRVGDRWADGPKPSMPLEREFEQPWWTAPSQPTGTLLVTSQPPGAEVMFEGHVLGQTPLRVAFPVGNHRFVARSAAGVVERKVEIRPGKAVAVDLTLWLPYAEDTKEQERAHDNHSALSSASSPSASSPSVPPAASRVSNPPSLRVVRRLLAESKCARLDRVSGRLAESGQDSAIQTQALLSAAECHLRRGNKERALAWFMKIAEDYATTPAGEAAAFEVVKLQSEENRWSEALRAANRYLDRYPQGRFAEPARFRHCELLVELGRVAGAKTCLADFGRRHPGPASSLPALLLKASVARLSGRSDEAARLARRVLSIATHEPTRQAARYMLILSLQHEDPAAARVEMRVYLDEFPRGPHADDVRRWYSSVDR